MNLIESIPNYKRSLRRKNLSGHTIKNYLHRLQLFVIWVALPLEEITTEDVKGYLDFLLDKGLAAQSINAHLIAIRRFYNYLIDEEGWRLNNPIRRGMTLRVPSPLPRHLPDKAVSRFFQHVHKPRDRAIFMLMLRCGLRVEEVANLTLGAIDYSRSQILVRCGKGNKDRVVYISNDAASALAEYLRKRRVTREQKIFLVEKGSYRGKPLSVRGIQKRIEYYARKSGVPVSCHQLRHTFARHLAEKSLPVDSLAKLLGHNQLETTQRYIDGADPTVQAEFAEAMAHLDTTLRRDPPDQVTPADPTDAPSPTPPRSSAPQAELVKVRQRLTDLPAWIADAVDAYITWR